MAGGRCFHEINAYIEDMVDGKLNTTSNSDVYTDVPLDMTNVDCTFSPYKGDRVKMYVMKGDPPNVYKIEPWEEVRALTGKITSLTQSYGTVDDDVIFYLDQTPLEWEANIGDDVKYIVIDGDYKIGKNAMYEMRCESIKKFVESDEEQRDVEMWFNNSVEIKDAPQSTDNNVDSDTEVEEQDFVPEHLKKREPNQEYYDLPADLYR